MTTQTQPNAVAVKLAHAADQEGLWAKDAARFEDVLVEYNIDPSNITDAIIREAHGLMMDGLARLQRMIRKMNLEREGIKDVIIDVDNAEAKIDGRKKPQRKSGQKRVKLFGFSVTAVLRWMGANDWTFDDAAIAVETLTMTKVSDVTIRLQLKAGREGKRGAPANISKSQAKQLREAAC